MKRSFKSLCSLVIVIAMLLQLFTTAIATDGETTDVTATQSSEILSPTVDGNNIYLQSGKEPIDEVDSGEIADALDAQSSEILSPAVDGNDIYLQSGKEPIDEVDSGEIADALDAQPQEILLPTGDGNYFYLQPDRESISESDSGVVRVKIGRSGNIAEAASVILKLVDISAHYGENYTAYIEDDYTEGVSEFGNVSLVDFAVENEDGIFEQELFEEEELADMVSEAGGADIVDSEGNVVGQLTADSGMAATDEDSDEEEITVEVQDDIAVDEASDILLVDSNPLRQARNQYTGTMSDRQLAPEFVQSELTDTIVDEDTTFEQDNFIPGELVQDDFPGTEYTLEFSEGETEKYLVIKPEYSEKNDGDSIIMCMLKEASEGMLLDDNTFMQYIAIMDEDGVATAVISMKNDVVIADNGKAYVEISREGAINNTVYANIYTVPGTAETGKDFSGMSAKLYFPMGIKTRLVEIPVYHGDAEKDFYVKLGSPVGCEIENNSTLVQIVRKEDMNRYSNSLTSNATLMADNFTNNTVVADDMIGASYDLSTAQFYGNTNKQPDGSVLMSGVGQENNQYNAMQIIDNEMGFLYDGIRITWALSHKMLISRGSEVIKHICTENGVTLYREIYKNKNDEFSRTDDYFFGSGSDTAGIEIGTVTTSWHGRNLSVYELSPIKRSFTFNLLPAKTPSEGGLDFVGCSEEEIAKYQHVIMNSSLTDVSCTIMSNEALSVSATGEEIARFTGVEIVAEGKAPYFVPVSKNSRTVNLTANANLINYLGRNGYISFIENSSVNENSFKGSINIRPVFEYIDADVEFLHTATGYFDGYKTNGTNNLVQNQFHIGDKLPLKAVAGEEYQHDYKAMGISYTEKASKLSSSTNSKGTIHYVNGDESKTYTIKDYYTGLMPLFTKKETSTVVVVSDEDLEYFDTTSGIFVMSQGSFPDGNGNTCYSISSGTVTNGYLYLNALVKDRNMVAVWEEQNKGRTYSGNTFYVQPDLQKETNLVYLSVSETTSDNAYFKLSGYADAPDRILSTGHISTERGYPASDALVAACNTGAITNADGYFSLDPFYAKGNSYVRCLVNYNGVSEAIDVLLPASYAPKQSVTFTEWNGPTPVQKTVSAVNMDIGIINAPTYASAGAHFDSISVIQGDRYILGAQILEMNGLETKLSVTVSDGHKYSFDGDVYSENVTGVSFIFMDAITGQQKSEHVAVKDGNKWTTTFMQFTPDSPESFSYGDVLYVQMQTDKKIFTDEELEMLGNSAPVMTYNPVATGYAVISDTSYEPQGFELDIPLDPADIMGEDAGLLEESRTTYGSFPFIGEIRFAVGVVGYLKAMMRDDDTAEEMIADLERMRGGGNYEQDDMYIGEGFGSSNNSMSRNTTKKMRFSLAFRISELPYGGTRMMIGVVGVSGNSTFEKRVNAFENAEVANDMFSRISRTGVVSKQRAMADTMNKVNSIMGGTAFSFSVYLGVYLDWGYLATTTIHDDGTSEITSSITKDTVFLGGGGFVGGGVTADGMKPLLVPPGIPCYGGFVASATVTDFFGFAADPYRTLKSAQESDSIDTGSYDLNNEIYANANLNLYAGVGLANVLGVRLSLGAGVEIAYSPKMSKWYPNVNKDWGVSLLANASGQVDMVAFSIPLASFSFPLYSGGFYEYFMEVRIGNRLINIVNSSIDEIIDDGKGESYRQAIETANAKRKELQNAIDSFECTGEQIKEYTSNLREYAYSSGLISRTQYYMSFLSTSAGVVAQLFEEEGEPDKGFYLRDHVDSKWVANSNPELFGAYEHVFSDTLVEDSYAQPSSQLIPISDDEVLMVYIGDDNSRSELHAATLMYSVYDVINDKWTDPEIVQNDGTADSSPHLCDVGDSIMISWVSSSKEKMVQDSEKPVEFLESQDIYTALFNKNSRKISDIEQITDDEYCDSEPQGVYDPGTGNRQVLYVKSAFDENAKFENATDELMEFINPYATYSLLCYMLYDNAEGKKMWAKDYYYPGELSFDKFESDDEYEQYVEKWKGQRFLHTVMEEQSDPLVTDLTVCESYNSMSVYAYSVDMDNSPTTYDDKEIYVQFHDLKNHRVYPPIGVTDDNICQTKPKLIKNGDNCYLFWINDNIEICYVDIGAVLKDLSEDSNNMLNTELDPDGIMSEGYVVDVYTIDAQSRYDGSDVTAIVDYHALTDDEGNLYIIWTRPVLTPEATSGDINELSPVEVYATAKINENINVTVDGADFKRGAKWSKPYRMTHTGRINDGVAATLSKTGGIMLLHNQYSMKYVGFDPAYSDNYKIVTRVEEDGTEQKYLEGQLYEMSPVNLVVTRCAPVGSVEATDFVFSDNVPEGGDTITVAVTLENTGLTSAKGYIAKFFEYQMGEKGEQIAAFESDETIDVNTAFARTFEWTLPENIDGLSILAEITEKKSVGTYKMEEFTSDAFSIRSDCELTLHSVQQEGNSFVASFTVANNGNTGVEKGTKANVHLAGLYGDPVGDYGLNSDILKSVEITDLPQGTERDYQLTFDVPAEIFDHSGFDAVEVSLTNIDDEVVVHSDEEFICIDGPMNFKLNNESTLYLKKGKSTELVTSFDGGKFIEIAGNIVYSVENPAVAVVNNDVVTAVGVGSTKITATMLPYGASSQITLVVSETSGGSSGGGSGTGSSTTIKNEDGSTTKTTTNSKTGEVTSTTTYPDGTVTTVKTSKDGSSVSEEIRKDGTQVIVNTSTDGVCTAEIKASEEVVVNMPVSNPEAVLVVVLTDDDGDKSYIVDATYTEDGVEIATDKNVTVEFICGERKIFDDVHNQSHWSQKAVDFVSALGIMKGTSENEFSPDDNLTRAMMVTILYRQAGEPEVLRRSIFTDVEEGSYYEDAVIWAYENKIVNGVSETSFASHNFISREQASAMIYRFAELMGDLDSEHADTNLLSYDDFDNISDWAISSMQWANGAGIINGRSESTLAPDGTLTRSEAAQILLNYMQK